MGLQGIPGVYRDACGPAVMALTGRLLPQPGNQKQAAGGGDDPYGYDEARVAASFAEARVSPGRLLLQGHRPAKLDVTALTPQVRKGFATKVLSIVLVQLIITVAITCLFLFNDSARLYVLPGGGGQWVLWTSYALVIVLMLVIVCGGTIRQKYPINMVLLFLFTAALSVFVGVNTAYFSANEVAVAFGILCAVVGGIAVFAALPCVDFTLCGGVMVALSLTLVFAIFIGWIVQLTCTSLQCLQTTQLVIASLAVFVFSVYLVYDIQLVMGGKRVQIGTDEYVFAALNIYTDIVMIFLYLLQIIGIANR